MPPQVFSVAALHAVLPSREPASVAPELPLDVPPLDVPPLDVPSPLLLPASPLEAPFPPSLTPTGVPVLSSTQATAEARGTRATQKRTAARDRLVETMTVIVSRMRRRFAMNDVTHLDDTRYPY
jgi:hypothetical protein